MQNNYKDLHLLPVNSNANCSSLAQASFEPFLSSDLIKKKSYFKKDIFYTHAG